ncbi:hypothetical protein Zmor_005126 [Zophobas morio]|uniref:Isoleucine--tRNA ligase, cytoplasmic n=1 Tax=Zophobas morio TaxID=2755281 RepID=A0AA38IMH3_9CUCU|nr:hypothetical protein Zmor_005126 [Zophobas morio]
MSKAKKNYPCPSDVVSKYGADALRLYLINSPVVCGKNLKLKEGVRRVLKEMVSPWYSPLRFILLNIEGFVEEHKRPFCYTEGEVVTDLMDRWVLSLTQSLVEYFHNEMSHYRLNVVSRVTRFFDNFTNWYVRLNRKRFRNNTDLGDQKAALWTLFDVFLTMVVMMAPLVPFVSETIYQHLRTFLVQYVDSVHYVTQPQPNTTLIDIDTERAVSRMRSVIESGRVSRDRTNLALKYPLPEVVIIHQDPQYLADLHLLEEYIRTELNVRIVTLISDRKKYGLTLQVEPDFKILGLRFKDELRTLVTGITALTRVEIDEMIKVGYIVVKGQRIETSEVKLVWKLETSWGHYEANSDNDVVIVMNVAPDSVMQDEGIAREVVNRVQKLRKRANLVPTDQISVFYTASADINRVAKSYSKFIETSVRAPFRSLNKKERFNKVIIEDTQLLKYVSFI